MSLKLVTRSGPPGASGACTVEDLGGRRFTIGRDASNDWTLASRVVSRHHCTIEHSGDRWVLTDTSTNGVYVGDALAPLGNGNSVELANGQRLHIGDYEIEVLLDRPQACSHPSGEFAAGSDVTQIEDVESIVERQEDSPRGLPPIYGDEEKVPGFGSLPDFDAWERHEPREERPAASPSLDHDHPTGDVFEPPRPVRPFPEGHDARASAPPATSGAPQRALPDDWLSAVEDEGGADVADAEARVPPAAEPPPSTGRESPVEPRVPPLPEDAAGIPPLPSESAAEQPSPSRPPRPDPQVQRPPVEPASGDAARDATPPQPGIRQEPASPPAPGERSLPPHGGPDEQPLRADMASRLLDAFYAGAGIDGPSAGSNPVQTMRTAGEILRCVTEGLIQLLEARRGIKAEMGVQQTVFAAEGHNNPLKVYGDAGEALRLLIERRQQGYLPARQAYAEAVEDIVDHELSLLNGVNEAWNELLARVDPEALEQRIGRERGLAGLLTSGKARCWDVYCERYREVVDDADRIFKLKVAAAYDRERNGRRRRQR